MDLVLTIKQAADSLSNEAELLAESHTLNGDWPQGEQAAMAAYRKLVNQSEALKCAAGALHTALKVTTQAISIQFIHSLKAVIPEQELEVLRERNRQRTSPGVCHTHDFCDANEVMAQAFHAVVGRSFDSEIDGALWEQAWSIASQKEFQLGEEDSDHFLLRIEAGGKAYIDGPFDSQIDLERLTEMAKLDNCKTLYHLSTVRGAGIVIAPA